MARWLKTGSRLKQDSSDIEGECATSSSEKTLTHQSKHKNRKYCDEYISFEFICRGSE
ncbi:hypothetical protein SK128_002961, partial [Halocaridina rubra]